jgi:hypothetical protein
MVIVHTTFNFDQGLGFLQRVSFISYGFNCIYFQFITYIFLFLNFVLFEFYHGILSVEILVPIFCRTSRSSNSNSNSN